MLDLRDPIGRVYCTTLPPSTARLIQNPDCCNLGNSELALKLGSIDFYRSRHNAKKSRRRAAIFMAPTKDCFKHILKEKNCSENGPHAVGPEIQFPQR